MAKSHWSPFTRQRSKRLTMKETRPTRSKCSRLHILIRINTLIIGYIVSDDFAKESVQPLLWRRWDFF